jgi:hypothetical protein
MNVIMKIYPVDKDQEKVIRMFLDALHVKYEPTVDESDYLLSSEANKEHLSRSIRQEREGNVHTVALDDIWK